MTLAGAVAILEVRTAYREMLRPTGQAARFVPFLHGGLLFSSAPYSPQWIRPRLRMCVRHIENIFDQSNMLRAQGWKLAA